MTEHQCPICRNGMTLCGHLLPTRERIRVALEADAATPVDSGLARFAADVLALLCQ